MSEQSEQAALAAFDEEIKENYRWNFTVKLLEWVFFSMGMSFVSLNTVLPAFVRHLTSSNFLIGLVPSLYTLGLLLPQILTANFTQKLRRNKDLLIFAALGERIPWLLLFLAVLFLSSSSSTSLLFPQMVFSLVEIAQRSATLAMKPGYNISVHI